MKTSSDRIMQLGGVLFGGGVTVSVGWGVLATQVSSVDAWGWPMWVGIGMLIGGSLLMLMATVRKERGSNPTQKQRGGANSVNIQAGRDARYNISEKP